MGWQNASQHWFINCVKYEVLLYCYAHVIMKKLIKSFVPPIIWHKLQSFYRPPMIEFNGNYVNWQDALSHCDGYDNDVVIENILEKSLMVASGQAVSERDAYLLNEVQYPWALISYLLKIFMENGEAINVLDFGGALGSTYRDCQHFFKNLNKKIILHWNVIEQPKLVKLGQQDFENETLHFFDTIEAALAIAPTHIIVLSSVIQYLSSPHFFLQQLVSYKVPYLIFDRTAFIDGNTDRLMIQTIRPPIYDASYPAWFLTKDKFEAHFKEHYDLITSFNSFESWDLGDVKAQDRGYVFKKK